MRYTTFYTCYSSGASVASAEPLAADLRDLPGLVDAHLVGNGDFVGMIDGTGSTVQLLRGGADRVWLELIDAPNRGAFGAHMRIGPAIELLVDSGRSFDDLKSDFGFYRWDGSGDPTPFAIAADQIVALAPDRGGCLATDYVTRGDNGVNYMYRELPANIGDSGWRFFAGTESDAYLQDSSRTSVFDVNTIANYQPDIVLLLDAAPGAAFKRQANGELELIKHPGPQGNESGER